MALMFNTFKGRNTEINGFSFGTGGGGSFFKFNNSLIRAEETD